MSIFHCTYKSKTLGKTHPFLLITPDPGTSYTLEGAQPLLVYALHGLGSSYHQMSTKLPLEVMANTFNISFVLPQGDRSFYVDALYDYESYLTEELPAFLEENFRLPARQSIMGISMGGYGAVNLYGRHPGLFERCCALSPALDIPLMKQAASLPEWKAGKETEIPLFYDAVNDPFLLDFMPESRIALFCGTADPLYPGCKKFAEKLKGEGLDPHVVFGPGSHDWFFWNRHLIEAMEFLTGCQLGDH